MSSILDNDNVKRGITFLFLNLGIMIFAVVIFTKLDVMAKKVESQTQAVSADIGWQGYLYHKTVLTILNQTNQTKENNN